MASVAAAVRPHLQLLLTIRAQRWLWPNIRSLLWLCSSPAEEATVAAVPRLGHDFGSASPELQLWLWPHFQPRPGFKFIGLWFSALSLSWAPTSGLAPFGPHLWLQPQFGLFLCQNLGQWLQFWPHLWLQHQTHPNHGLWFQLQPHLGPLAWVWPDPGLLLWLRPCLVCGFGLGLLAGHGFGSRPTSVCGFISSMISSFNFGSGPILGCGFSCSYLGQRPALAPSWAISPLDPTQAPASALVHVQDMNLPPSLAQAATSALATSQAMTLAWTWLKLLLGPCPQSHHGLLVLLWLVFGLLFWLWFQPGNSGSSPISGLNFGFRSSLGAALVATSDPAPALGALNTFTATFISGAVEKTEVGKSPKQHCTDSASGWLERSPTKTPGHWYNQAFN